MTLWHYAVGGEEKGPIDEAELLSLFAERTLTRETLVWRPGTGDWARVTETPELMVALEPEDPPTELAPEAMPPKIPDAPLARPWARFWATVLDLSLLIHAASLLIVFVIFALPWFGGFGFLNSRLTVLFVYAVLVLSLAILLRAAVMAVFGTSPGKALFGIRVVQLNDQGRALFHVTREMMMWLRGLALYIFPLTLVTLVLQYRRVADGEPAGHDRDRARVEGRRISGVRFGAGVIAALLAPIVLNKVTDPFADRMIAALAPAVEQQTFVNPVTGKQTTFDALWVVEDRSQEDMLFVISSDRLGTGMHFGLEKVPETMTHQQYAEAIAAANWDTHDVSADWVPVTINGQQAIRTTMQARAKPSQDTEMTLMLRGQNAWRVAAPPPDANGRDAALDLLIAAIVETIE
ncbi:MAG TPA: RDD family protein [Ensifer sp.]|jgi:uncharacterized RDD family membrane protein YckC|uniref:RDD family protein n=1 Tax=Ensifer sp. TaxID=1872086 RepID=UPI002E148702|nr:RDD family protein [Ensifer sp.]